MFVEIKNLSNIDEAIILLVWAERRLWRLPQGVEPIYSDFVAEQGRESALKLETLFFVRVMNASEGVLGCKKQFAQGRRSGA